MKKRIILLLILTLITSGCKKEEQECPTVDKTVVEYNEKEITETDLIESISASDFSAIIKTYEYEMLKDYYKDTSTYSNAESEVENTIKELEVYYDNLEEVIYEYYLLTLEEYKDELIYSSLLKEYTLEYIEENNIEDDTNLEDEELEEYYYSVYYNKAIEKLHKDYKLSFKNKSLKEKYKEYINKMTENIEENKKYYETE